MPENSIITEIDVQIRPAVGAGALRAWADVELTLEKSGRIKIYDCCIIHKDGKQAFVAYPSKKGKDKYFPVIDVSGSLNKLITQAVLSEYKQEQEGQN